MHVYEPDELVKGLLFAGCGLLLLIAGVLDRAQPVRQLRDFPLAYPVFFMTVGLMLIVPALDPPGHSHLRTNIIIGILGAVAIVIGAYSRLYMARKRQEADGQKQERPGPERN